MQLFLTILVTFIAGAGAGLGTGFAGMSAAVVIAPMLVTFLGVNHYVAVGIALASDVLASAMSAIMYAKHKNIDIKHAWIMMLTALVFTVGGTFLGKIVTEKLVAASGHNIGEIIMTIISLIMTAVMGIRFIARPVMTTKEQMLSITPQRRIGGSIGCGAVIGIICGFAGAGGGIMMLIMLTTVLGYELKTAVGTSVMIMTFTALAGAVAHFLWGGLPSGLSSGGYNQWLILALCMGFTLIWAGIAALIANRVKPKTLNTSLGILLLILGVTMIVFNIVFWSKYGMF